uniref:Uncharacterized protein n=1 Tax=Rhipicephalus pulchellus TaxID=72859 RepID=L7M1J8_RHIPC
MCRQSCIYILAYICVLTTRLGLNVTYTSHFSLSIHYKDVLQVQPSGRTSLTVIALPCALLYTRNKHASALCVEININPCWLMCM